MCSKYIFQQDISLFRHQDAKFSNLLYLSKISLIILPYPYEKEYDLGAGDALTSRYLLHSAPTYTIIAAHRFTSTATLATYTTGYWPLHRHGLTTDLYNWRRFSILFLISLE
jgi:hypothetical protein